ncbi:hypothetical protein R3P38DRAFT_3344445 [Favolaschia claudopus]|uniref:Histone deacetylase complex subunit SAP30 Sin3 binding domain-containing protein n=1 Tax=Favolaschia claudopus TaxID=2862362 RepID=A0AAW0DKA1_9AGAR
MPPKSVVLTPDQRAICRVRYRHVATYMDPGPQPLTPNDRICQAIAAHYKNGTNLEHGSEYSPLLFPFGNKRAVSRHVNKGGPKTVEVDREIAVAWVVTRPEGQRGEILALLGLDGEDGGDGEGGGEPGDADGDDSKVGVKSEIKEEEGGDSKVGIKDEEDEVDVKKEEGTGQRLLGLGKRKLEEVEGKANVVSKRTKGAATSTVKAEEQDVKIKPEVA